VVRSGDEAALTRPNVETWEGARELPVLTEVLDDWELPNLQLALDAALARDGLLADTSALTRVLLGAGEPGAAAAPDPHGWLESFAHFVRE